MFKHGYLSTNSDLDNDILKMLKRCFVFFTFVYSHIEFKAYPSSRAPVVVDYIDRSLYNF